MPTGEKTHADAMLLSDALCPRGHCVNGRLTLVSPRFLQVSGGLSSLTLWIDVIHEGQCFPLCMATCVSLYLLLHTQDLHLPRHKHLFALFHLWLLYFGDWNLSLVCVYMYTYLCVCIYMHANYCVCICVNICIYVHVSIYVCICVYVHVYKCVYLCACVCMCIYSAYVFIYMHVWTKEQTDSKTAPMKK